ncbi:hypothetical protein MM239_05365 [Belliella sp. DSM 111904]|uniref:Tetratricopeptide repeat-containing protein n=1 Tax=Belliella filtrata TaxID=2923435 RepID=A0ABS9UXA6_9BACT|nr:hypothetical protein [Belliella filtrata]MCH7408815.1 hypothetical protein [Belliella filtrata]
MVNFLRIIEHYEESAQLMNQIEQDLGEFDNVFLKSKLYQNAARLYNQLGLLGLAVFSNLKAIAFAIQEVAPQLKASLLGELYSGQVIYHSKQNDYAKAILFCYKGMAYREPNKELQVLLEYYQNVQRNQDSIAYYFNELEVQL